MCNAVVPEATYQLPTVDLSNSHVFVLLQSIAFKRLKDTT